METLQEKVSQISLAVKRAGGRAMLVGGCVRDKLQGIPVKDYDIEVYGLRAPELLESLKEICSVEPVGMSFGVFKVRHYDIDLALPRRENKSGAGHRGFIVDLEPELDFAAAAARRDFTVNAIMCDALTGEIIDPWGGREDLQRGILRHVSPAFAEDPLRVLRGMQFIGRFGFTADRETVELSSQLSQAELPPERLAAEWSKLLIQGKYISKALNFLRDTGWVRFYPALNALIGCPQNPQWHPEGDVWNHTLAVADAGAAMPHAPEDKLVFMLAALCHDFGKVSCTTVEADGRITSCGHDTFTAPAEEFITSIWNNKDLPKRVIPLISRHMHPWQLAEGNSSDKAYRKLALHVKRMDLLADLAQADVLGIIMSDSERKSRLAKIDFFRQRAIQLAIADAVPQPLICGRHLVARGMMPGREFKPLLDRCFEAQLAGEFSTLSAGLEYLDKILCEK